MKAKLKWLSKETGQVLVVVLVLLAVGALILVPLLSYMDTGLKSGTVYEDKATDFYSADSGVEDGLWQIKNDHLQTFISAYDIYGFDTLGYHYAYPSSLNVNNRNVNVTVDNVWMPKDYTPSSMGLSLTDLHNIVEDARLVAAGSISGTNQYKIALSYNSEGTDPALYVSQIGVWIPPGFTYTSGTCNLENIPSPHTGDRPNLPITVSDYAGGTVVVWNWTSPVLFSVLCADLLGVSTPPNMKMNVTLNFTAQTPGATPNMVSWIYTGNSVKDIKFAWDADVRVFKIDSVSSGGTEVKVYGIKVEQRSLAKTIAGDYVAIGGTNLISSSNPLVRDTPLASSDATVGTSNPNANIPNDAEVAAAYLYWSGWYNGTPGTPTNVNIAPLNPDTCGNFNNWTYTGTAWSSDTNKFVGHFTSGGESAKYITLTTPINLSSYAGKTVTISWQQWVAGTPDSNDRLYLSISNDGGTTWSDGGVGNMGSQTLQGDTAVTVQPAGTQANFSYIIPSAYLNAYFKMRLYVQNFSSGTRNCYVDNISIQQQIINDTCDVGTWPNWTNGGDWSTASSGPTPLAFMGHDSTSSVNTSNLRYITLTTSQSVSAGQTVTLTMQQWAAGSGLSSSDRLYVSFSSNGGSSWSTETEIARGSGGTNFGTATTPVSYTTTYTITSPGNFKIRFRVYGFTTSGRNVYVDNVVVKGAAIAPLNPDTCSNLNNWTVTGDWKSSSGTFQGQDLAGTGFDDPTRYLTLSSGINLGAYNNQIVDVSWQQWATGTLSSTEALQFQFSGDGGNTWSTVYTAAQDDIQVDINGNGGFQAAQPASTPNPATNPPGTQGYFSIQIPNQYLTYNFKMQFYLKGFGAGKYCYIDNIYLTSVPVIYYDVASYAPPNSLSRWTSDADWTSYYDVQFAGTHSIGNRYLTMTPSLNLSFYTGQTLSVTWNQSESGTLTSSDGLQFQFSGDGGNTWSMLYTAFTGNIASGPFTISIPSQYITNSFKLRFYLLGFGTGKVCYVDDMKIYSTNQAADLSVFLKINGTQVYFDSNDAPQQGGGGTQNLTADRAQVINNADYGNPHGYSYSSFKDVTALVRAFSVVGPNGNRPGNATYTVGGVDATSNANDEWAYAGWSLVIIYTSPATLGHQLYLYDTFLYCNHQTDLDFDQDGSPGGTISGFLVPAQITGETNAAKITAFVGEGDDAYTGDFISLNAPSSYASNPSTIPNSYKLWDGINTNGNSASNPNNVWNSQSIGLSAAGVDVDTFNVPWASGLIAAGDTTKRVDMYTDIDIWNLVYIILSFRSLTTTGGAITYLI